jgi:intracellular sulfur oxidation DsrE/DsrF family protein
MTSQALIVVLLLVIAPVAHGESKWPAARSPVIPQAHGFAVIPDAAIPVSRTHTYKAIFDATRGAEKPTQLVPAVNMLGSALNALGASGIPLKNARFVIVFHGPAVDGLLNDRTYRAKFRTPNPNLPVLAELRKAGVEVYVCGQYLVSENIDRATLSPDVEVASGALIVLMTYQNSGYALLSF